MGHEARGPRPGRLPPAPAFASVQGRRRRACARGPRGRQGEGPVPVPRQPRPHPPPVCVHLRCQGRGGRGRAGRAGQRLAVRVVPTDVGGVGFPALCHVIVPKPVCPGERRASLSAGAPSRGWRSPAPSQEGSCPALQRLLRVRPILPPPLPSFLGLVDSSGLREKMTVLSLPGELRDGSEQKKRCLFSVFR